jgi:hypothetical protein
MEKYLFGISFEKLVRWGVCFDNGGLCYFEPTLPLMQLESINEL